MSEDFQKVGFENTFCQLSNTEATVVETGCQPFVVQSQQTVAALEASLQGLQSEHDSLRLQQQKVKARLSCLEKGAAENGSLRNQFVFMSSLLSRLL